MECNITYHCTYTLYNILDLLAQISENNRFLPKELIFIKELVSTDF